MADKFGSYTRVLVFSLLGSGVFHTALLYVPSVSEVTTYPESSSFVINVTSSMSKWSNCSDNFNVSKLITCTYTEGNEMVTLILYFIFRMLGTMCGTCSYVLIHAQTIQMCKIKDKSGNTGALGRQYVYEALAQAIVSPLGRFNSIFRNIRIWV